MEKDGASGIPSLLEDIEDLNSRSQIQRVPLAHQNHHTHRAHQPRQYRPTDKFKKYYCICQFESNLNLITPGRFDLMLVK